jgi:hypothetical protein
MDDLDRAAELEQAERDSALRLHALRPRVVPMCESCEETPVVVSKGVAWRFCAECAEDHLRRNQAA